MYESQFELIERRVKQKKTIGIAIARALELDEEQQQGENILF